MRKVISSTLFGNIDRAKRRLRKRLRNDQETKVSSPLFDGEGELFIEIVSEAKVYGEYGMGTSTHWVANNTQAHIIAVDTSLEWVKSTRRKLRDNTRFELEWIDVGAVGNWGMPSGFSKRKHFINYVEAIWTREPQPNVVLIDGRFRLSCWFMSVLRAAPGTHILFDDYIERKAFHVVEEFFAPTYTNNRQALFVVPERIDRDNLIATCRTFQMVRD